jgi:dTDP-4-dehydrorhamnose reductase
VLLLGSSGQVGHELRRLLEPAGDFLAPAHSNLDVADAHALRSVVREWRPQLILNAAAYTAVDAAENDQAAAAALNVTAPATLAAEAAALGALLVHYSTDYVFDGAGSRPYREDDTPAPQSVYGRTKLEGERAIRRSGCRHLILRTSWVYSARGRNFLLTILRLAAERDELRVVDDQRGSPTLARSLAQATVRMLERIGSNPVQALFHVTGAGEASWHDFARAIVDRGVELGLCRRVHVIPIGTESYPTAARRPAYSVLDNERLFTDFGIRMPRWQSDLHECLREIANPSLRSG